MSFKISRWHMSECNKMCVALVSVGVLLGCAAPLQEGREIPKQIQCRDHNGQILYIGPYEEESGNGYLVQVDDHTTDFYRKDQCHKMPA